MAKRKTVAALALISVNGNKVLVSTKGSEVAPGSKWKEWKIKWGDGEEIGGNAKPNETINHDYPVIPIDPAFPNETTDKYDIVFEIKDNKGGSSQAVVDNVIITRNPLNPPIPGPNITLLNPTTGIVGSNVTIIGTGFGTIQGGSTVTFDGTPATINSWSATGISVVVPTIGDGTTEVIVTVSGIPSPAAIYETTSVPPPVEVFDFYVTKAGNNAWDGTSPTFVSGTTGPKLTIAAGVGLLSAGKSLGIGGGTYIESGLSITSLQGTSWSNKVRIANYNDENVIFQPAGGQFVLYFSGSARYIEFDGINIDGANATVNAIKIESWTPLNDPNHIRIQNAEILGFNGPSTQEGSGILVALTNEGAVGIGGNEFLNLVIHRCFGGTSGQGALGIYIQSPNNIVDGCEIYDVSFGCLQFSTQPLGINNVIRNCVMHSPHSNPGQAHVALSLSTPSCRAYNNIIYNWFSDGANTRAVEIWASNNSLYFTTIYNITGDAIVIAAGADNIVRNNVAYIVSGTMFSGSGTQTNNSFTNAVNPQFVNAGAANFHLTVASPSDIQTGGVSVAGITTDKDGVTRPNLPSRGAYQLV